MGLATKIGSNLEPVFPSQMDGGKDLARKDHAICQMVQGFLDIDLQCLWE